MRSYITSVCLNLSEHQLNAYTSMRYRDSIFFDLILLHCTVSYIR